MGKYFLFDINKKLLLNQLRSQSLPYLIQYEVHYHTLNIAKVAMFILVVALITYLLSKSGLCTSWAHYSNQLLNSVAVSLIMGIISKNEVKKSCEAHDC